VPGATARVAIGHLDEVLDRAGAVADDLRRDPLDHPDQLAVDDEHAVVGAGDVVLDEWDPAGCGEVEGGAHLRRVVEPDRHALAHVALVGLDHHRVADPLGRRHGPLRGVGPLLERHGESERRQQAVRVLLVLGDLAAEMSGVAGVRAPHALLEAALTELDQPAANPDHRDPPLSRPTHDRGVGGRQLPVSGLRHERRDLIGHAGRLTDEQGLDDPDRELAGGDTDTRVVVGIHGPSVRVRQRGARQVGAGGHLQVSGDTGDDVGERRPGQPLVTQAGKALQQRLGERRPSRERPAARVEHEPDDRHGGVDIEPLEHCHVGDADRRRGVRRPEAHRATTLRPNMDPVCTDSDVCGLESGVLLRWGVHDERDDAVRARRRRALLPRHEGRPASRRPAGAGLQLQLR
jgi:hypothetical protein